MSKTIVWRIHDQKPGHANQTRGLVRALAEMTAVECYDIAVSERWETWSWVLTGTFPPGKDLPRPHLIAGAGHATHLGVLAARRAYGGKTLILMRPTLPMWLFDLCVVPQHDGVKSTENVIETLGVLNAVTPSTTRDHQAGLFLVGGPTAATHWDSGAVWDQILAVARLQPTTDWIVATSRRTPTDFHRRGNLALPSHVNVVPHEQTDANWLPQQLRRASQVWVSADSASMVYEALTSGAAVGLLSMPGRKTGRVASGMQQLVASGWVTRFEDWDRSSRLTSPALRLHEAQRCAELICDRFQLSRAA